MICRHTKGDPSCSSHPDHPDNPSNRRYETSAPSVYGSPGFGYAAATVETPDSEKYTIERFERVGDHVVLDVLYPNCKKCAYEGHKVMVFLNVTEMQAMRWRIIDPHFRDAKKKLHSVAEAPSPAARFPASVEGWDDAIDYAQRKENPVMRTTRTSVARG